MLNRELRPFLSKWHPRLREYEKAHPDAPESGWPGNDDCRAELRVVQIHLVEFALGFARLAGVRNARSAMALDNRPERNGGFAGISRQPESRSQAGDGSDMGRFAGSPSSLTDPAERWPTGTSPENRWSGPDDKGSVIT